MHFLCQGFYSFPIQPRKHIFDEERVQIDFYLFEFGFFGVEREGRRRGFAGFAGAGEEVEGEEFHLRGIGRGFIVFWCWLEI